MFSELGHNFPVQLNVRLFEIIYQPAVRYSISSCGGVYFYLPQGSHISFFLPSVVKSVQPGVEQGFSGHSFFGFSAMAKTLNLFKNASPPFH